MKLIYLYLPLLAAAAAALQGCSDSKENGGDDDPNDGSVEVKIETEVTTRANVTTAFADGDAMNLFAKAYNSATSEDKFPARRAEMSQGAWTTSPKLRVKQGELAFLYAVSPYNAAYNNPAAIPVKVSDQIDLLYSGAGVPVNFQNTTARFTMRHAMALVSFNIVGKSGELQSLSINGDQVYTSATFNAEKVSFAGTGKDQYTHAVSATIADKGWTEKFPQMWFIPFSTKKAPATLTAVIDGKTYMADFPEVEMRSGNQYIFRLTYSNYGLEFVTSRTEVIPLDQVTDSFDGLENYGEVRFTVTGNEWTLPALDGSNVFGRYSANGSTGSYNVGQVQTVSFSNSGADNAVGIESWNSTGFTLESLTGVKEIDLTAY